MATHIFTDVSPAKLIKTKPLKFSLNYTSKQKLNTGSKNVSRKICFSVLLCLGLSTVTGCKTTQNKQFSGTSHNVTSSKNLPPSSKPDIKESIDSYSPKATNKVYLLNTPSYPNFPNVKNNTYILSKKPPDNASVKKPIISDLPAPPPMTDPAEAILAAARYNSSINANKNPEGNQHSSRNNTEIPAFKKLMDKGIKNLKMNNLNAAEINFSHAQRLIPQSSAVYFYLGQVALKKKNPRTAEAMARRGLVISESELLKKSLWQLIKRAEQMQKNKNTITEVEKALQ